MSNSHFCLGHVNFGQLTTHVPHSGYRVFTVRALADAACDEARRRNPEMRVLVCTPMGTPVRTATNADR